jgi:hypothetical protein
MNGATTYKPKPKAIITNWERYNTCEKKAAYRLRQVAITKAKEATVRMNCAIEPYHCQWCGNYHIGHRRVK